MTTKKWIRPKNAPIAGVCGAFSNALGIDAVAVRLLWLAAGLIFGTGFCLYLLCWWFLPAEDRQFEPDRAVFLGVCLRLSQRMQVEVALVRLGVFISFFVTGTLTFWAYFIAYLLLPKNEPTTPTTAS